MPPSYRIERLRTDQSVAWRIDAASCQVLFALDGGFALEAPTLDQPLAIEEAQTAVVPATSKRIEVTPTVESTEIIVSGVGGEPLVQR